MLILIFVSCKTETNQEAQSEISKQYTCPMHPQVIQDKSGTCPMCGMDLVEVTKSENTSSNDFSGYLDKIRITTGIARYTSTTYVVQSSSYPISAGVLIGVNYCNSNIFLRSFCSSNLFFRESL